MNLSVPPIWCFFFPWLANGFSIKLISRCYLGIENDLVTYRPQLSLKIFQIILIQVHNMNPRLNTNLAFASDLEIFGFSDTKVSASFKEFSPVLAYQVIIHTSHTIHAR